ncbi:MAG: hypothetical protein AAGD25_27570 [Cyanobacteria bacterium P01_F01_bin.150]
MSSRYMKDKQKVTFYIPQELHRQLKIRAALDCESMSDITERAIHFYLHHSDVVDGIESSHGRSHQIYSCPECETALLVRDGDLQAVGHQPSVISDVLPDPSLEMEARVAESSSSGDDVEVSCDKQQRLVPC